MTLKIVDLFDFQSIQALFILHTSYKKNKNGEASLDVNDVQNVCLPNFTTGVICGFGRANK